LCERFWTLAIGLSKKSRVYGVIPWTPVSILIKLTNIFTSRLSSQESKLPETPFPCILRIDLRADKSKGS
jgi:hypothetical protein